jgi:arylsulfatase A-like enzyme
MSPTDQHALRAVRPKNAVVILLHSLNRHLLGAYGGREFATPNLDRLAARSLRFTRHYTGSLPCMPARHDILCGALDFLWKPWGSIELWEDAITCQLHAAGVATQLISDHPHLFEAGGENYHIDFSAWDYVRGHESDPWKTRPDPSWIGSPKFFERPMAYDNSRGWFRSEADFPGPKTMQATADWLDENTGFHDRFFLFVDEFDPHEPFDTPEPYLSMYDANWTGAHLIWPPYVDKGIASGHLTVRQARQIRALYGGKLTMIDHWLGRVLDALDRNDLWKDTLVVLCTDHGHYLGEKDIWGKPPVPVYQTLGHIPLLMAAPGVAPGECDALTTSVDLFATIADLFGVTENVRQRTHGRSLLPLLSGEAKEVRDWLLTGVWGREVCLVDKTRKYCCAPAGANAPLDMVSNRWSTMPTLVRTREESLPFPDQRARLGRAPGSTIPVIHQQWDASDALPFWAGRRFSGNHLYDLANDPDETANLAGTPLERDYRDQLRAVLEELEAPEGQFKRLGLN